MVVRLCCGQDHGGPGCPDGLVMCCICFNRFQLENLWTDEDNVQWDICLACGLEEENYGKE